MSTLEELEVEIAELRQLLYNATHGRVGARGIYIGDKRLLADATHLYQEDSDGTQTRLDDTPAASPPKAHKDSHDPHDGSDKLDSAAAAAITGVQAAGAGSAHSYARSDHAHAIAHNISNNALVTIDGTANAPANLDYAKFTASGLEGKTYAQVMTDLPAATLTAPGKVELATAAETTTGTDATRAVTPDGLAGSVVGKRIVYIKVFGADTAVATGDGKAYFTIPSELNGMNLVDADAAVYTVSSSGTPTVQVHNLTDGSDMLSTVITIDAAEYSSYTAATPPVIDGAEDDVVTGDRGRIDVDVAGTNTAGLDVILTFALP